VAARVRVGPGLARGHRVRRVPAARGVRHLEEGARRHLPARGVEGRGVLGSQGAPGSPRGTRSSARSSARP
jgi:hypothetical protein